MEPRLNNIMLWNWHAAAEMWYLVFYFTCSWGLHILVVVLAIFTPANEVIFSSLFVCLSVCLLDTLRKNFGMDLHNIFKAGCQWPIDTWLNFGGNPDHCLDTWVVFRIRHY